MTYREHMREAQRAYLLAVMAEASGKIEVAANLAGCNRTHFYGLLKRHGIGCRGHERIKQQTRVLRAIERRESCPVLLQSSSPAC